MEPVNEDIRLEENAGKAGLAGGGVRFLKAPKPCWKRAAVFRIRGVAVARLELYGWEQVDSKWRGAARVLAAAGSIRNSFTFFRRRQPGLRACVEAGRLAGSQLSC